MDNKIYIVDLCEYDDVPKSISKSVFTKIEDAVKEFKRVYNIIHHPDYDSFIENPFSEHPNILYLYEDHYNQLTITVYETGKQMRIPKHYYQSEETE